jgi:DNA polymerase-1
MAKAPNFGLGYGMGAQGFWKYTKANFNPAATLEETTALRDAFFAGYADLRAWQQHTAEVTRRQGYTSTAMGRRVWFCWQGQDAGSLEWDEPFYEDRVSGYRMTLALNVPIQGSAAEVLQMALVLIEERLDAPGVVVATVHDDILVETADDPHLVRAAAATISEAMTEAFLALYPDAPVGGLAEPSVGENWADMVPLDEWLSGRTERAA